MIPDMSSLMGAIAPVLVVGVLATLMLFFIKGGFLGHPYRRLGNLFTPAETSFYHALNNAVGNDYRVFGKVRVADVITPRNMINKGRWWRAFTRVSSKHVDYVLVDPSSLAIVCAIELDDASHGRRERVKRDVFLNKAFKAAGMPLLRFTPQRRYDVARLRDEIQARVGIESTRIAQPVQSRTDSPTDTNDCPQCGAPLLTRTAKKGANAGKQFLGCSAYPRCKYTRELAT